MNKYKVVKVSVVTINNTNYYVYEHNRSYKNIKPIIKRIIGEKIK